MQSEARLWASGMHQPLLSINNMLLLSTKSLGGRQEDPKSPSGAANEGVLPIRLVVFTMTLLGH